MTPKKIAALTHEVRETGDVVVFDRQGSQLLLLNDMGAAVWLLLDGERSVREIASEIASTLNDASVGPAQVEADVQTFLETLQEHGLVELD